MESSDESLREQRLEAERFFRGGHYRAHDPFENYHAHMAELQHEVRETPSAWHSERCLREMQRLTEEISRMQERHPQNTGLQRWIPSDLSQWERLYGSDGARFRQEMIGRWVHDPWDGREIPVPLRVAGVDMAERTVTVSRDHFTETLNDSDRRRAEAMNTEGQKVHITTRDGYKKTIRMSIPEGSPYVTLSEPAAPTGSVSAIWNSPSSHPVHRRDFEVVRKGVFYDLRSGQTTTEYWAVER